MTESATTGARRRLPAVLTGVLVVMIAVAAIVYVAVASRDEVDELPPLPDTVFSPAGTALPDGMRVPEGARLVGTPLAHDDPRVAQYGVPLASRSWRAVLSVEGDVLDTWTATRRMVAEALGVAVGPEVGAGCFTTDYEGFRCDVSGTRADTDGSQLSIAARLVAVPGQYVIVLSTERQPDQPYDYPPGLAPTYHLAPVSTAPPPPGARPRPGVGEPLDTTLASWASSPEDFVLVEGSQVLVQYTVRSGEAGFGVLFRVLPGASVNTVAAAYAATPRLGGAPITQRTTTNDGQTVTSYRPIGEAGGYSGVAFAVDNTTGDDYVYLDVFYD
jgi:hypothetical protein